MEEIVNLNYRKKTEENQYTRKAKEYLAQSTQTVTIYRVTHREFMRHENRATGMERRREFERIISRNDFDRGDAANAFIVQSSGPFNTGQNSRWGGVPRRSEFFETRRFIHSYMDTQSRPAIWVDVYEINRWEIQVIQVQAQG